MHILSVALTLCSKMFVFLSVLVSNILDGGECLRYRPPMQFKLSKSEEVVTGNTENSSTAPMCNTSTLDALRVCNLTIEEWNREGEETDDSSLSSFAIVAKVDQRESHTEVSNAQGRNPVTALLCGKSITVASRLPS